MMRQQLSCGHRQHGATLVVGLVLLVLMTLLVLASFRLGKSNLEIVGNMQHRNEYIGSANQTIEAAITSPLLTTSPAAIFPAPCGGANTQCHDVNGDGTDDVKVTLTPTPACIKAETIKNTSLTLGVEDDVCRREIAPGEYGIEDAEVGNSLCANSVWDIRALAQDIPAVDEAAGNPVVINQGVAVRVRTVDVASSCP